MPSTARVPYVDLLEPSCWPHLPEEPGGSTEGHDLQGSPHSGFRHQDSNPGLLNSDAVPRECLTGASLVPAATHEVRPVVLAVLPRHLALGLSGQSNAPRAGARESGSHSQARLLGCLALPRQQCPPIPHPGQVSSTGLLSTLSGSLICPGLMLLARRAPGSYLTTVLCGTWAFPPFSRCGNRLREVQSLARSHTAMM